MIENISFRAVLGETITDLFIIHWFVCIFDMTIIFWIVYEPTRKAATVSFGIIKY